MTILLHKLYLKSLKSTLMFYAQTQKLLKSRKVQGGGCVLCYNNPVIPQSPLRGSLIFFFLSLSIP